MDNKAQIEKVVIINDVNEALTVSSLQIAEHFNKSHAHVMRDIKKVITDITSTQNRGDVTSIQNWTNLFYESTYPDSYGRPQRYYECTRDGFSLLAMGFTGKAALEWKLKYIEAFNKMEKHIKNGKTKAIDKYKQMRLEIMAMNAKARTMKEENKRLDALIKSGKAVGLSVYDMLDLIKEKPQKHEKTYSASEVGVMLGVSANKIGRLATANNLKTEEYGDWFKETINDGSKEVSSFRYNEKGVEKLRELLNPEE